MKHKNILLTLLLLPLAAMATEVKSPNGNIVLNFTLDEGRPTYTLSYKGKEVVRPSHLGLELAKDKHASMGLDEDDLMTFSRVADEKTSEFYETWKPVWGESSAIQNHYNELAVTLERFFTRPMKTAMGMDPEMKPGGGPGVALQDYTRRIIIRFRVYDDGIGFRYEFPQQRDLNYFLIKEEHSEFAMTGDHTAWWLPGDYDT